MRRVQEQCPSPSESTVAASLSSSRRSHRVWPCRILTQLGVVYSIPWPDMYLNLLANLQFFNVDIFRLMTC